MIPTDLNPSHCHSHAAVITTKLHLSILRLFDGDDNAKFDAAESAKLEDTNEMRVFHPVTMR
jgi:hypothetical protein